MFLIAELRQVDGTSLGVLVLNTKVLRSGKQGWFGQAKLEIAASGIRPRRNWWQLPARPTRRV